MEQQEERGAAKRPLELGWDGGWEEAWRRSASTGLVPGRVLARHRSRWVVAISAAEAVPAVAATGAETATVGDWVALEGAADAGLRRIRFVLPRRTALVRREAGDAARPQVLAANIDLVLVIAALTEPLNARRVERLLATAWESGATPLLLLTKADLAIPPGLAAALADAEAVAPGVETLVLSARGDDGLDPLAARLGPGITAVLLGPSGVGKSTLVNRLAGQERLRTSEILQDGRGRHTTTHRELVVTKGGALLIDTPGIREIGLWGASDGLDAAFSDVEDLGAGCRFRDCAHDAEPGCEVRRAIESGALEPDRLESWRALRAELARLERKTDALAASREKARVRAIHRARRRGPS